MISPITLDVLRVLDAIERRGSFAAAADELYRVPSALSYSVSKLEEDLGLEIFDRSKRKAQLTAVGRLLLDQGRKILIATDELTALAKQAEQGWELELRIGVDSLLEYAAVYELVERFQKIQPHTEVKITEEVLGGTWDALVTERCDIVIGAAGDAPGSGFGSHLLGQVEFEFVVAANHPLTQIDAPIPASAIQSYAAVIVADSSRQLPSRSWGLFDGQSRIVVPSVERKIEAQKRGLGVGYLPVHRIKSELQTGELKILMLEDVRPAQPLFVAWPRLSKVSDKGGSGNGPGVKAPPGRGVSWFITELKHMAFNTEQGLHLSN